MATVVPPHRIKKETTNPNRAQLIAAFRRLRVGASENLAAAIDELIRRAESEDLPSHKKATRT